MNLDALLRFTDLVHKLGQVERSLYANGQDRKENDIEHSYQLAITAWYIVDSEKISFNLGRVIEYALVHDFVEVFAGDTYFYGDRTGKEERESAAAQKLLRDVPEFASLHQTIVQYEKREDAESSFVYALDKLLPVLNIYLDHGRTWREYGITSHMLIGNKTEKISVSPEIKKYFDELVLRLKKEEPELFSPTTTLL